MARGVKIGIIGTVFAGMVGVAAFGAFNIFSALDTGGGGGSSGKSSTGTSSTAANNALSAKEVSETATDFLTAWAGGDISRAAGLTDSVQTATSALRGFASDGHITKVEITPGTPSATSMPYTVIAHVGYQGKDTALQYRSSLTVGRDDKGDPAVTWASSVLYPGLADGDTIVTGQARTPDLDIVDRHGTTMTAQQYPSLARIFDDFATKYGDQLSGGTPAVRTYVQKADGSEGQTLVTLQKGKGKRLTTTLDSKLQAAAEKAVAGKDQAGVVALDTRTGGVLAAAYAPAAGWDTALQGSAAPGSTFKIVTAAALLEGGLTPNSPAPCVNARNYKYGRIYHNDSGVHDNPGATLRWDFAVSCNTGFITQAGHLPDGGLRHTAAQFGLTQPWSVGTPTPANQPTMPDPGGDQDELTSEMIGQGQLAMSPLVMASVAATASTGTFHQPLIVDRGLVQGQIVPSRSLPPGVSSGLRAMMHDTITYGTAGGVMRGFGSGAGAKTGSAEVDGAPTTNGWFTAYSGHVSAAAIVQGGGHGNTSAGPIVAQVLAAQ
ncbi:penicillin-binding transpeptidase domain-containing protein [Actinacidiphila acidipaludis]|uniref:Penicillin-binding protein n=1 Tax=Actinacidiphila acidipaludis TaxID=2873382 RepID=A0ABS7Q0Z0_9ACTN|nr:penicillin-binding transpeptidase domain-containing protein [Streptomyces acidipaludis]MBY8876791.1 penicillin-binding protein [Streptomyces acidipaludis]